MPVHYNKDSFVFDMIDKVKDLFVTYFYREVRNNYPDIFLTNHRSIFTNGYCGFYARTMGRIMSYIINACNLNDEFCVVYPRNPFHIMIMVIKKSPEEVKSETIDSIKHNMNYVLFDAKEIFGPFDESDFTGAHEVAISIIDSDEFHLYTDDNIEEIYDMYYNDRYPDAVQAMKSMMPVIEKNITEQIGEDIEKYNQLNNQLS